METTAEEWGDGDEVDAVAEQLEHWNWSAEQAVEASQWYKQGGYEVYAGEADATPLDSANYDEYGTAEGSYFALDATYETLDEEETGALVESPFEQESYWQQYGQDVSTEQPVETPLPEDGYGVVSDAVGVEPTNQVEAEPPREGSSPPTSSPGRKRKKKVKTKQERVEMRQEQLEKEEEEKQQQNTAEPQSAVSPDSGKIGRKAIERRPTTFLDRERAKLRLRMRKMRAIARKRIPPQVRILTQTRQHLSPMEIYFGGSVESVLSDIFWASIKGDLRRVRFLVEVEGVSVSESQLDPWSMEQSPLHWAAKGGHAAVIEYLMQHGANPRAVDETGSMPLHLACWAGHIEATVALLRATDTKDLYVQDYDAALAPLDWAHLRGHVQLVKAIEKFEDSLWLPKFVDDLIRGIIRYKIKLFKEPPRTPKSPTLGVGFLRGAPNATQVAAPNDTQPSPTETDQMNATSASKSS